MSVLNVYKKIQQFIRERIWLATIWKTLFQSKCRKEDKDVQLADFKALCRRMDASARKNVATLHEGVQIFHSAFVPMMSCMQVIRLKEFDATTYYDCGIT